MKGRFPNDLNIGEFLYQSSTDCVIEYMVTDVKKDNYRTNYELTETASPNNPNQKYTGTYQRSWTRTLTAGYRYTDFFYDIKSAYKRSIRLAKAAHTRRTKKLEEINKEVASIADRVNKLEGEFAAI